jgi:hypothetical protein
MLLGEEKLLDTPIPTSKWEFEGSLWVGERDSLPKTKKKIANAGIPSKYGAKGICQGFGGD